MNNWRGKHQKKDFINRKKRKKVKRARGDTSHNKKVEVSENNKGTKQMTSQEAKKKQKDTRKYKKKVWRSQEKGKKYIFFSKNI
jgi:hypothetical protein